MKHLIAYSGGLGSFETARLVVEQFGPSSVQCVFTDTLTEDEDLYRFLQQTIAYLGCELTCLCYGKNIWEVFEEKQYHGNNRVDTCSMHLKREMFRKYLSSFDPSDTTLYYGIGSHEAHRITAIAERWSPFPVVAPLIVYGTTKEDILLTLDKIHIDPPRLYDLGFEHNNCGGFCVKTGQRQMLQLLKVLPERYHWHEERQERLFKVLGKKHGFIRRTEGGELKYLSLLEFRKLVERGEPVQKYQDGSCACF